MVKRTWLPKALFTLPQGKKIVGVNSAWPNLAFNFFRSSDGRSGSAGQSRFSMEKARLFKCSVLCSCMIRAASDRRWISALLFCTWRSCFQYRCSFPPRRRSSRRRKLRPAVLQLHHPGDGSVQKYRSGDHQKRSLIMADAVLQPNRGIQVQVVGGLVQQQGSLCVHQIKRARLIRVFSPERSAKFLSRKACSMPRPAQIFQPGLDLTAAPPAS